MELLGLLLMVLGMITISIGGVWVIVIAFQEDFGTGLAWIGYSLRRFCLHPQILSHQNR